MPDNPGRPREDSIIVKSMIKVDDEKEISLWLTRVYTKRNIAERISVLRELAQKGLKDPDYIGIFKEVIRRGKFVQELQAIEEQLRTDKLRHRNPSSPPKIWWNRMFFSMSRQYPRKKSETLEHYRNAIARIVGGIWANYSEDTKSKLLKLYENPVMKNPLACPCCGTLNTVSRELHLRCSRCGKPLISVKVRRK